MTKAQEILKQIVESAPPRLKQLATDIDTDTSIRVGQYYMLADDPYLLAQVGPHKCQFIALLGGNRWNEGTVVENIYNITPTEFAKIQGNSSVTRLYITY
jgi:hypothetical protein